MADKWEYWTTIFEADLENPEAKQFVNDTWPKYKFPKHSPVALIPMLNDMGENGWELVNIQPVGLTDEMLVKVIGSYPQFTNAYLCVWKRRIE